MPDLPIFDEDAPPSIPGRVIAWARTEAGGWAIVGGLAVILLVIAVIAMIAPRGGRGGLENGPPGLDPSASFAESPTSDLADLTVAPDRIRDLSPAEARAWNAALGFSTAPNPPAAPFIAPAADVQSYGRALDCLTAALYYEAGGETAQGQAAVAQVVLNRVRHPAYPRTVCGVVFQGSERTTGCQFTFTCDGALQRPPSPQGWARARTVATSAVNGRVMAQVGTATHYHADWVAPFWASRLAKIVQIQTHIFYRWNRAWGLPSAFDGAYVGREPEIAAMAGLSTAVVDAPAGDLAALDLSLEQLPDISPGPAPIVDAPALSIQPATDSPAQAAEPARADPAVPPTVRREATTTPDPLVNAGAGQPQRPRSRIATPSGW